MDGTENHSSLCYGCLSVDRRVKPLTEFVDLFANLLEVKHNYNYELKLSNTKLCWECLAMLKRTHNFQKRIKDAHCMLSSLHLDDSLSIPSLSTLSTIKQDSYQAVVQYDSGEMKTTRDICFGEVVVIKEEVDHDLPDYNDEHPTNMLEVQIESYKPIKNECEAEIKDDSNLNDKKGHIVKIDSKERRLVKKEEKPELLVNQIITCEDLKTMKMLNKKEIKRIKCNEDSLNDATIMKNAIDFSNVFKYFVKVKMNKNDIEESLEMKRNSADYNTMPYKCDLCVCGFMSSFYLRKHEKTYHTEGDVPFECTVCKRSFPTRHAVLAHTATQHSTLRCSVCDHLCWGRSMPVTHLKTHLFTYTCNFCNERFSSIGSFVAHRRKFHRQFICDHCGKQVSSKIHMEIHLRIHGDETFECAECGKTFPSRRTRLNHVAKYHTGAKRTREASFCVECDKQFENTYKYKKHLRNSARHNSNNRAREKEPIPCAECGKIVTRKYMRNHIKLYHLKKNNHYCEICDKHFVTNSTLRNHHRFVHEKQEKPRNKECELCGRLFFTNRMLINHIRTHTGEKPHICKHCGASFAQNTAMKMHERRHKQC